MSEDEIRKYLSRPASAPPKEQAKPRMRVVPRRPKQAPSQATYKDFSATHLFCPRCQKAMPVRENVMLFLPDGDLHNYACTQCGTSLGTRKAGREA